MNLPHEGIDEEFLNDDGANREYEEDGDLDYEEDMGLPERGLEQTLDKIGVG